MLKLYIYIHTYTHLQTHHSAYSGLRSDLLGATNGCSWHRYVNAHMRNIIANANATVLLHTVRSSLGANRQNTAPATNVAIITPSTVYLHIC